jgi:multiple antibiotic resistance protein
MDLKPLVTLLAIVNPPAIMPFFIHYTQGFSRAAAQHGPDLLVHGLPGDRRQRPAGHAHPGVLRHLAGQLPGGRRHAAPDQRAEHAERQPAEAKPSTNEMVEGAEKAAMGASIAVVPLTIPLLTGPATMSTVVIYAEQAHTWLQLVTLVGYGVVIGLVTALSFSLAHPIARSWARPASTC